MGLKLTVMACMTPMTWSHVNRAGADPGFDEGGLGSTPGKGGSP